MNRVSKLIAKLKEKDLDGIIVYNGLNRRYISGFTGSSGYLYVSKNKKVLLTDFRYIEQGAQECEGFEVIDMLKKGHIKTLDAIIQEDDVKKIAFEQNTITYQEHTLLEEGLEVDNLVPTSDIIESLRMIKEEEELEHIKKAVAIGDKAFAHILNFIKVGVKEKDIALELEYFMKKEGAEKLSFDSIVASGVHSSMPHAKPTNKTLDNGDFLTLDFGCIYKGYCSDMTRTLVIGKANDKQKEIYNIVLEAQLKGIEMIKEGITGSQADKTSRNIIKKYGYDQYFGHSLGHSLGLFIHEAPRLSPLGYDILKEKMVVTVEPGIYIPQFGGVRIEDMVVVEKDGNLNLTQSPKELIEL
ncbi:Xaa-Pro aminopeptidase [Natranaerovirga hydrolytica]|uniref:Xaa-Pro aminopeptidase n=1 Tax=Natranaerovirga hydrolytica TaxID=680378 RepID=A0A4R1N0E3_9FIRM|nr:aminopeptidase P family protein [Natranaerovirga hydrolytica]TCK98370.1 Xaa-Pro aminopeptidase [Natranaerovirga hydrolytica]